MSLRTPTPQSQFRNKVKKPQHYWCETQFHCNQKQGLLLVRVVQWVVLQGSVLTFSVLFPKPKLPIQENISLFFLISVTLLLTPGQLALKFTGHSPVFTIHLAVAVLGLQVSTAALNFLYGFRGLNWAVKLVASPFIHRAIFLSSSLHSYLSIINLNVSIRNINISWFLLYLQCLLTVTIKNIGNI